jgi:hypothetical protein
MTDREPLSGGETDRDDSGPPQRDWIGRLLAGMSRTTEHREGEPSRRFAPPLVFGLLAFAAAAGVTIGLILTSGGDGAELAGTRMTLELAYPTTGEPTASLEGQPGAAPAGARIACRATSDNRQLGADRAAADGSFDVALEASAWPLDGLSGGAYDRLNETVECRVSGGPWVSPLRPPRVAVN